MPSPEIEEQIRQLNIKFENSPPEAMMEYFFNEYGKEMSFATSLGAEDQVITHMLSNISKQARIFTLDTGRLFPETLDLIDASNKRLGINIEVFFPEWKQVEQMVNSKGINLFYESIENRKECCNIRKIVPMMRALKGTKVWISGLRAEQSVTRQGLPLIIWDENFNLIKINPLHKWTEKQVWDYIQDNNIPFNKLHEQGFPSIGCQPCTRAIEKGEDIRAGRWWWELPENKECGLHKK